jgi:hypothetical protein
VDAFLFGHRFACPVELRLCRIIQLGLIFIRGLYRSFYFIVIHSRKKRKTGNRPVFCTSATTTWNSRILLRFDLSEALFKRCLYLYLFLSLPLEFAGL